jgi:hypothetical protein
MSFESYQTKIHQNTPTVQEQEDRRRKEEDLPLRELPQREERLGKTFLCFYAPKKRKKWMNFYLGQFTFFCSLSLSSLCEIYTSNIS